VIAMLIAAGAAFLLTVFGTPLLIAELRRRGIGQQIRDDGPIEHPHAEFVPEFLRFSGVGGHRAA